MIPTVKWNNEYQSHIYNFEIWLLKTHFTYNGIKQQGLINTVKNIIGMQDNLLNVVKERNLPLWKSSRKKDNIIIQMVELI